MINTNVSPDSGLLSIVYLSVMRRGTNSRWGHHDLYVPGHKVMLSEI